MVESADNGSWYSIKVGYNKEGRVSRILDEIIANEGQVQGFSWIIDEYLVPEQEEMTVVNNKSTIRKKKIIPGYIFIKFSNTSEVEPDFLFDSFKIFFLKNCAINRIQIDRVSNEEMLNFKDMVVNSEVIETKEEDVHDFNVGDRVRITAGAFEGVVAIVSEVCYKSNKLIVLAIVFGRSTSVEVKMQNVVKYNEE